MEHLLGTSKGLIEGDKLRFRFSPCDSKLWSYEIKSNHPKLQGLTGSFQAVPPSEDRTKTTSEAHPNWWIDDPHPSAAEGVHPGAKSVNQWREEFLSDFEKRMDRCDPLQFSRPRTNLSYDGFIV